jgi:hypothetical protein
MEAVLTTNADVTINKSANSIYKEYKNQGGTLSFKEFIEREKQKGVFPLNIKLNEEVENSIIEFEKQKNMDKKILGLPVKTVVIAGSIIVLAVVITKFVKRK